MEKRVKKTTGMFTSGKQGSLQMRTKEADGQGSEGRAQCVRVERKKIYRYHHITAEKQCPPTAFRLQHSKSKVRAESSK